MSHNSKNNSSRIKKALWYTLGMISLVFAYIGFVTPGIPFSIFLVFSAYCFSKSSKRMHDYLYNHKHFGPFLTNFVEKRIFPTKAKYAMVTVMSSSLLFLWFTTYNLNALLWSTIFMTMVATYCWTQYPGSEEEYQKRNEN